MHVVRKEIILESRPEALQEVEDFFSDVKNVIHLSSDVADSVLIILTELVNNAILHGNQGDPAKKVLIQIEGQPEEFILRVKDEGKGFDDGKLPDPTQQENLYKTSGRGIFIVKHMVKFFSHYMEPPYHVVEVKLNLKELESF